MASHLAHTKGATGRRPILVVNPNASETVTRSIEAALSAPSGRDEPLRCVTLADGPPAVESHEDFERAIPCVEDFVRRNETVAAAFVIACFSDPGVKEARRTTECPVVGIQEASVALALTLGSTFGIVALAEPSVQRQRRALTESGMLDRLAASRPAGLGVAALQEPGTAWPRIAETGTRLRDDDGADVIILGCAGMGAYRADLERLLGVPVIDPCRAGVAAARTRLRPGPSRLEGARPAPDTAEA